MVRKWIRTTFVLLAVFVSCISADASAAAVPGHVSVAVMDFGTHKGAATADISLANAEKASCDYVIERLVEDGHFDVMDKELVQEQIQAENLDTVGLVDPDTARRIGEILGVSYIVYGNVTDMSASDTGTQIMGSGVDVHTVKCHIIARMMDVQTGDIVMAAKGEGSSKSSLTKVGTEEIGFFTIGSKRVSQVSVHNALQKAAYGAVDVLVQRLYGEGKK